MLRRGSEERIGVDGGWELVLSESVQGEGERGGGSGRSHLQGGRERKKRSASSRFRILIKDERRLT